MLSTVVLSRNKDKLCYVLIYFNRQLIRSMFFFPPGIDCPKGARTLPSGQSFPADPFGEEALLFVKEICMQREVLAQFYYIK